MKTAHLILAHKNPAQLDRLIKALQHPESLFYIHIDKKANQQQFEYLSKYQNTFFIKKRAKIYWAGHGTIEATINGIEEILPYKYDYINVISAQDFPLQSAQNIYNFFDNNKGKEFITCLSVKNEWKEAAVRVEKYHLINWRIPGKFTIEKIINKILPQRKFPFDFELVGRANWFTITSDAAAYIIQFLRKNPKYERFFKYSWGGDELFFSTILYNSKFKNKIVDNLVYIDWSGKKAHPKILNKEDYNALISSEKLFARKFDSETDDEIIKMLEQHNSKNN